MTRFRTISGAIGMLALILPAAAFAHPGHEGNSPFLSGLIHPLTGIDHLMAMLLVGMWSGLTFNRRIWLLPVAFVLAMLVGFGAGMNGFALERGELLIVGSCIVLGLLTAFARSLPMAAAIALVGLFAFAHGHAHGSELAMDGAAWPIALGMGIITAVLHVMGLAFAHIPARWAVRGAGVVGAAAGTAMLVLAG